MVIISLLNPPSDSPIPETRFQAMLMARCAILGPTPGRRTRSSTVSGTSPPKSRRSASVVCFMYRAFLYKESHDTEVERKELHILKCFDPSVCRYPPEPDGVDQTGQRLLVHLQDGRYAESLPTQPPHGRRRHLVLRLTGQHE